MSYGRQWLDETGTEDSNCRAMRSLGSCIRAGLYEDWALPLFEEAAESFHKLESLRAIANLLLGLSDFFKRYTNENEYKKLHSLRKETADRLLNVFVANKSDDWYWPEDRLAYENAVLPHALFVTGYDLGNAEMVKVGIESLDWLMHQQMSSDGIFCPIGNEFWYEKGEKKAEFDQQPIESHTTVMACLAARDITTAPKWTSFAHAAFNWYVGKNALGKSVYNPRTGGCGDGLQKDGVKKDQGAESLLVFLLSLLALETAHIAEHAEEMSQKKRAKKSHRH